MTNEFRKVLDLIKRTGDKLVFYDAANDSSFVILPLVVYEKMLSAEIKVAGLTEEELLAKINRDIALWRAEQGAEQKLEKIGESEIKMVKDLSQSTVTVNAPKTEDIYQFEPVEE